MLSRLVQKSLYSVRAYGNRMSISLDLSSNSIESGSVEKSEGNPSLGVKEEFAKLFYLDLDTIPKHTNGNYHNEIKAVLHDYRTSLNKIAGGLNNLAFFSTIEVYTFLEHVPLTEAASVKKSSPTSYLITSHDPNNAPLIETALKKSHYGFNVVREFGEITVTVKDAKIFSAEFRKTALEATLKSHKEKINRVFDQAKKRFETYPEAVKGLAGLVEDAFKDMDGIHLKVSA